MTMNYTADVETLRHGPVTDSHLRFSTRVAAAEPVAAR